MADKRTYQLDEETTITDDMTLLIDDASFAESKRVKVSTLLAAVVASGNYVPYSGATEKVNLGAQDLTTTGYINWKKSGVFAYLPTETDTTTTAAATYYPVAGTFTNAPVENFTAVDTPGIRYNGTPSQFFEIDWHCTFEVDNASKTVTVGVAINETVVAASTQSMFCRYANDSVHLSGTYVVELATNDEVQLVVASDYDGLIVSFDTFNVSIRPFFY